MARKANEDKRKQEQSKNALNLLFSDPKVKSVDASKQSQLKNVAHKISARQKNKSRTVPVSSYLKYIKRSDKYMHKLLGVSVDLIKHKKPDSEYKNAKLHRLYNVSFNHLKKKKVNTTKWRAVGFHGSFYKDSKFLSFFMHKLNLIAMKKKYRIFFYYHLHKYVNLYSSYIRSFTHSNFFLKFKFKLYNRVFSTYRRNRYNLFINKHVSAQYAERLFSFFYALGHLYISNKSKILPIVKKCISRAHYDELMTLGSGLSFISLRTRN